MDSVVVVVVVGWFDWCVPPRNHLRHRRHHDNVDGWRQPDGFVEVGLPLTVVPPEQAEETYGCGTTWVEDRFAQQ